MKARESDLRWSSFFDQKATWYFEGDDDDVGTQDV